MLDDLFTSSCQKLRDESRRLGLPENFRFLTNSREAFRSDIPALILDKFPSPNPFGKPDPLGSCEAGSAYFVECWKQGKKKGEAVLQQRMQAFLWDLKDALQQKNMSEAAFAARGILSAYYNPFRNGAMGKDSKTKHPEVKKFLEEFWKPILNAICPPLMFAFAAPPRDMLYKHFGINGARCHSECLYDKTLYNNYSIKIHKVRRSDVSSLIVSIPSLSRYAYKNYSAQKGNIRETCEKEIWNIIKEFLAGTRSQSHV